MKRASRTSQSNNVQKQNVVVVLVPPVPCIPIIIQPNDLNGIYDHFMKARPSKRLPIGDRRMVLVYEGEGGNA